MPFLLFHSLSPVCFCHDYMSEDDPDRKSRHADITLDFVGEEYVRSEIEFVPPKVKKVEYYRRSYECRAYKKGTGIPHVIKGSDGKFRMVYGMASTSTVAWVVYQKYVNSIPLYRQEKEWGMYGCAVTRGTLANWVIRNSEAFFKPMCGLLKAHIKSRGGHPVLRWMMDNIYVRTNPSGNIKPDKEKSTEKIDSAVATVMALDRAIRLGNSNAASVYDERGIMFWRTQTKCICT